MIEGIKPFFNVSFLKIFADIIKKQRVDSKKVS